MSAELEDQLRAALRERADPITRDQLRHTEPPVSCTPRRRPLLAGLTAAATVAAIAGGIAVLRPDPRSHPAPPAAQGLDGTQWTLVHVHDARGDVDTPASVRATVAFTAREVMADDGCNALTTHYDVSGENLILSSRVGSTLVGCFPTRRDRSAALHGIDAVMQGTPLAGTAATHLVGYRVVSADTLTLTSGTVVLRFTYAGRAPSPSAPSSTPTRS